MNDPKEIAAIEDELARDKARFAEIEKVESQLLDESQHDGFRDAAKAIELRSEQEMLDRRMFQNRQWLNKLEHWEERK